MKNLSNNQRLLYSSILTLIVSIAFLYLEIWFLFKGTFYSAVFIGLFAFLLICYDQYKTPIEISSIEKWAEETKISIDKNKVKAEPFKVEFDEKEWNILKQKLELTRVFAPINQKYHPKYEFGFDPEYAKELADYWKTNYNWQKRIEILNRYPQYRIVINDVTIHYVHFVTNQNESSAKKKLNLLLLDGWPGSYFGFYKMIDYLNDNYKDYSFDITVPSIPGFGYSTPLDKPIDVPDTAQHFDALMRFIHDNDNVEYYIHGQDWGSIITNSMGTLYPNRVKAIHLTMPPFPKPAQLLYTLLMGSISSKLILSEEEIESKMKFSLGSFLKSFIAKTGYFHMQATTPDTLCIGLTDSPIGLLGYLLEKYSLGSFNKENQVIGSKDGNLSAFDRDDLLDIVTYYWMSNSISSSCRFYKSNVGVKKTPIKAKISKYPTATRVTVGVLYFKNEVFSYPQSLVRLAFPKLNRFNLMKVGGHFANFENPELCAKDFVEFIKNA